MNKITTYFQYILIGTTLSLLAACGGGGGGDSDSGTPAGSVSAGATTLSGKIADGYLRGARVFLDRNSNGRYDNGEPTTQSTAGGIYTLAVNSGDGELYPVVAEILPGQTVDEETGVALAESFLLESPAGKWQFVSPLTTLVKQEQDKNPSFTELQAVLKVRSEMGIDDNVSLFNDYLALGSGGTLSAQEYGRAHKVARVVAALMAGLRTEIVQNLGGQISAAEAKMVSFMISDQISQEAAQIKQALNTERNNGVPVDVNGLAADMESSINPSTLDADLLALYVQREEQNLPNWDMQPPTVLSQSPAPSETTSVDITVGIVFDEPLDETLIDNNLLQLSGPNGVLSGVVSYNAALNQLSFVPEQVLLPYSTYQVTLKKELADSLGNRLAEDLAWNFVTTFNQLPPPLPDF